MNWRIAWGVGKGLNPADASATKVYGTEFFIEAYRCLMEVMGANAVVRDGSPGAVLAGRVERAYRGTLILTFGGGTNEVQRDIIAMVGPRHAAGAEVSIGVAKRIVVWGTGFVGRMVIAEVVEASDLRARRRRRQQPGQDRT